MQNLKWVMGLNVVLGALVYRGLLTFQPRIATAKSTLAKDAEAYMFVPAETAPLMIVLISLWLLYHRRVELFVLPKQGGPVWLVAPFLAVGVGIYAWAIYTKAADLQALSLIANLVGCAILWRGLAAVRVALVPILLLLFAVPLPSPVIANLIWEFQLQTAVLAGWMLYAIGIPAVVSSEMIMLPMDTYQVIENCSGLRSMQTLAMFSILMTNLFDRGGLHGAALFSLSIPIAFLMNGIRVITLILNPHSEIHSIHVAQGLVVLMGGLIALYVVDGLLAQIIKSGDSAPAQPIKSSNSTSGAPLAAELSPYSRAVAVAVIAAMMLGVQYLLPVWKYRGVAGLGVEQVLAELTTGTWESRDLPEANNDLAKVSFRRAYRKEYSRQGLGGYSVSANPFSADAPIEVFWGVGEHLDRFRTPFSPKTAFPGRGWVVEGSGEIRLDGTESMITWRQLKSGTHRMISYHWYEESRGLLRETLRSFLALDRSPFAREFPVMAIRMATEINEVTPSELKNAHNRLTAFHGVVSAAVGLLKEQQRNTLQSEVSRFLNFPLWERVFPLPTDGDLRIPSKFSGLVDSSPMAWALHY